MNRSYDPSDSTVQAMTDRAHAYGDSSPALIRRFIAAGDENAADVSVWGTGTASRELLHVDDAAHAITLAVQHYDREEPVTSNEITIRDLVTAIVTLTGFTGDIRWDAAKPGGQPRRKLETSRAKEWFVFEAEVGLENGLPRTIQWWEGQRQ